jgi:hypothetical protein
LTTKAGLALTVLVIALVAVMFVMRNREDSFALRDIDGVAHGSLENPQTDLTLLFFMSTLCPISGQYAPEIQSICKDYEPKGVGCLLVFPEARTTRDEVKTYLKEFGHTAPAIADSKHILVERAGATVTPEAAVLSRTGELLYRGRIDDRHASLGTSRPEATRRDLREALEAISAGMPIASPRTEAVGCFIEN